MPLERARDSVANLARTGLSSSPGKDVNSDAGPRLLPNLDVPEDSRGYWESGKDWGDYVDVVDLGHGGIVGTDGDSDDDGSEEVCFGLFSFFSPRHAKHEHGGMPKNESSKETPSSPTLRSGGIMKRQAGYPQQRKGVNLRVRQSFVPVLYQPRSPNRQALSRRVRFTPTKAVVRICPLDRVTAEEKAATWWSENDFADIKKEISLLVRPDEIESLAEQLLSNGENEAPVSQSWLSKKSSAWWHKYGDSRRGLERYASPSEAPQIMRSSKEAIRQVLMEQERQEREHRCWVVWPFGRRFAGSDEGSRRMAQVYKDYTAWAVDLALASGASDADAVRTDFDDTKRKTREYYLLKQLRSNDMKFHRHMPAFMAPRGLQPKGYLNESMVGLSQDKKK